VGKGDDKPTLASMSARSATPQDTASTADAVSPEKNLEQ